MVGDLVVDGVDHLRVERLGRPELALERPPEDRDPRRRRRVVRARPVAGHARVQAVEPVGADGRELLGRRPLLDHDRDAAQPLAELVGERVDRLEDPVLEGLVLDSCVHRGPA